MKFAICFAMVSAAVGAPTVGTGSGNPGDWVTDLRKASYLDQTGRYAEAQGIYDRILPILGDTARISETDILRAEFCNDLAAHYHHLARFAEAVPLYQQAIAIWRQTPGVVAQRDLALALGNLAALNRAQGRFPAAESLYREEL